MRRGCRHTHILNMYLLSILAQSKWAAGAKLFHGIKAANEHPEKVAKTGEFLLALVIYALIAAVVGAIAAAVAKLVFEADKETVQNTFLGVGVVVLIVCVICYLIA